jgi:Cu/Ag efflux protein CusF
VFGIILAVSTLGSVAMAQEPAMKMGARMSATATVQNVDTANRRLMLKDAEGDSMTVQVPEDVKLEAIKKGDRINVDYYESMVVSMKKAEKGAKPSMKETTAQVREPGQLPAGVAARQINATAVIEEVDKANNEVTIKGPKGNMETIKVTDPAMKEELTKLKKGDMLTVSYMEAIAITVEPPEKKKG